MQNLATKYQVLDIENIGNYSKCHRNGIFSSGKKFARSMKDIFSYIIGLTLNTHPDKVK